MSPEQAANLLRDDYFLGEIEKIRQQQIDLILNSSEQDIDARENAYRMIKCLTQVVNHFQSIVDTAEIKRRRLKIF
jgi:hypothetical protein